MSKARPNGSIQRMGVQHTYGREYSSLVDYYSTNIADFDNWYTITATTPGYFSKPRPDLKPLAYQIETSYQKHNYGNKTGHSEGERNPAYKYYDVDSYGTMGGCDAISYCKGRFSADDIQRAADKCAVKLLTKVKDQSVNIGIAFGERQQTIDLLANTAKSIAGAIHDLKRFDYVGAARHLGVAAGPRAKSRFTKEWSKDRTKAAANAWLSLQYGWKPLLSDVFGAAEQLAKLQAEPALVTVRSQVTVDEPRDYVVHGSRHGGQNIDLYKCSERRKLIVRRGVTYFRPAGPAPLLSQLGITNPVSIAWELVPFSFVFDWFLPIGNWLGTLDAPLGLQFHSGWSSVKEEIVNTCEHVADYSASGIRRTESWNSSSRTQAFRRTPSGGFPTAGYPRFKNPVSNSHALSALALLSSAFTGNPSRRR